VGRPGAGPAISLSFLLTAVACGFAALCYAELASMIPIAGSAYTYAYATLGEISAWIIGWDLILEYAVSNMAVAVGFSAYLNSILDGFGLHLPAKLAQPMFGPDGLTGAWFNISALLILLILTYILVRGVRESAGTNNVMVGDQRSPPSGVRLRRHAGGEHGQLATPSRPRLPGRADGRGHRVFHLHWVRFGFHGGRGV